MAFGGINYWAVLAAGVAGWVVGAIWYTALANPWMAALGKTKADLTRSSGLSFATPFIVAFVALLVMAWALAGIVGHLGPGQVTVWNGVVSGFFLWLGFVATTMVVNHQFTNQRPSLTAIDGGHWLAVLLVQGAVIGFFGTR